MFTTDDSPLTAETQRAMRRWLKLGVAALAIAGLFSILIVVARTPAFANISVLKDFFRVALVVHVDLSVLVWFLAVAGMLFAAHGPARVSYLQTAALLSIAGGMGCIALSPFTGQGAPLMSNYVPVLTNGVFFLGLGLVLCSVLLASVAALIAPRAVPLGIKNIFSNSTTLMEAQHFGIATAAAIVLIALACFAWSAHLLPRAITGQEYYELLFWGGGHVLQFTHVQLMMVAWVALATAIGLRSPLCPSLLAALYCIGLVAAFAAPIAYFRYGAASFEYKNFFTQLMITANGLAPFALLALLVRRLVQQGRVGLEQRALWASLWMSLILFGFGGILGNSISGQNVTIPAHYHGSIVSVTLAFMGLAYIVLPALGYRAVAHTRLAFWQPFIYGGGQLIHISALAWSGGYGVLRKTPGALAPGMTAAKLAMGIMGLGGLIAIIGGLMFVLVMWSGMHKNTAS